MALFNPARHQPLRSVPWNADLAINTIRSIVSEADRAFDPVRFWPVHPREDGADAIKPHTLKSMYFGASGVLWALAYLQKENVAASTLDIAGVFEKVYFEYVKYPDAGHLVPGLLAGESGVLLLMRTVRAQRWIDDRLYQLIESNIDNETLELFWGAPGTMTAALWMARWTAEPRWKDLYLRNAAALVKSWDTQIKPGVDVWTQHLYGKIGQYLGAAHGFAGNVGSLLRGADLFDPKLRNEIYTRSASTVKHFAVVRGGMANWRPMTTSGAGDALVQWCHGAPGFITELGKFPRGRDAELDALLLKAGELIWHAGPLDKGCNPCHGTDGNALAFLQLHERTGDPQWLERAQAFAMHAIEQFYAEKEKWGCTRFALWTGDLGLAVDLHRILKAEAGFPCLDYL